MKKFIHIVCLDVPWPADYGGAIDMMNRIMQFKKAGIGIHLHYFSYNERGMPNELNQFCESIHVYERKTGHHGFSLKLPYIVASRMDPRLLENLEKDDHPVLLEGIHCTGYLEQLVTNGRKVVVRMHNEEHLYYRELARSTGNLYKKCYYRLESHLLKKYSQHLSDKAVYACVSLNDIRILEDDYQLTHAHFLPTFPAWQQVSGEEGLGTLCLFHGNLSVPENEKAAMWLLKEVFTKIKIPFVVAGKKPSARLQKQAHVLQHTCIVADPTGSEIDDLVRKAHINVLPCFNKNITGIRLKLLHALFEGRHCVVNAPMVDGTGLEGACHIATNAESFASVIMQLHRMPYSEEETRLRKRLLGDTYNNEKNTQQLIQWLY